jgi:hypothetical protein
MSDWLGYEEKEWSIIKVKDLLRDLIKSKIIYPWDEAVLYSFLLRKGLLSLQTRHKQFFKNLIEASRTDERRKAIEECANSNSKVPPDLSEVTPHNSETREFTGAGTRNRICISPRTFQSSREYRSIRLW